MHSSTWKQFEARVAKRFGGKRRGPDTEGGKSDVICEKWAVECCVTSRPTLSQITAKVLQSERNAEPGKIPVAIVKKIHRDDDDALVVMRLKTFQQHFLPEHVPGSDASSS